MKDHLAEQYLAETISGLRSDAFVETVRNEHDHLELEIPNFVRERVPRTIEAAETHYHAMST